MGFDTIICNGSVVTATDTYVADVANHGWQGRSDRQGPSSNRTPRRYWTLQVNMFSLAALMCTRIWTWPFGGTTSADDFETGTRAAAFGGTTTLIDFAIQYKGQPLRKAFDTWMDKASNKAVCDYAFSLHRDRYRAHGQLQEMNALVGEGVTSSKLFHGLPRRIHA